MRKHKIPSPHYMDTVKIKTKAKGSRWKIIANNGKIIDAATEDFATIGACEKNLIRVAFSFFDICGVMMTAEHVEKLIKYIEQEK